MDNPFVAITVRERGVVLGTVGFLTLFIGVLNLTQGRPDLSFIFLASLLYFAVLSLPLALYRPGWGWFHPIVFLPLWTLGTKALPSVGMFIAGLESHSALAGMQVEDLNHLVVQGLLLQALGWLIFYAGATTGQIRTLSFSFPPARAITPKLVLVTSVAFGALAMLMYAAGGLDPLLLQRGFGSDRTINVAGHWVFLARYALPAACWVWLGLRPRIVGSLPFWGLFSVGLFIGFAATGSRSSVVLSLVVAVAIWALRTRKIPYFLLIAIPFAAIVFVGVGEEFRADTGKVDTVQDVDIDSGVQSGFTEGFEAWAGRRSEHSALTAILGRVPDEVALLYGRSYLSVPAAVVPSAIWPGKPKAGGKLTTQLIFGRREEAGGMPPSTAGEAFWNFHVPGVVVIFFLWGRLAKWLSTLYSKHAHHGGLAALYVVTLVTFSPNTVAFYTWLHSIIAATFALMLFCGPPRVKRKEQFEPWHA